MIHLPDPDDPTLMSPDFAEGAFLGCDCADCREARLADPDRIYYSAHEMADAWTLGWHTGQQSVVRRLLSVLTDWLKTDPYEPVPDETQTG